MCTRSYQDNLINRNKIKLNDYNLVIIINTWIFLKAANLTHPGLRIIIRIDMGQVWGSIRNNVIYNVVVWGMELYNF